MLAGVNWFTAAVLYVIIWWTVLFAVLPIGTRPVADADPATGWRGAPEQPRMARKGDVDNINCHIAVDSVSGDPGKRLDQLQVWLAVIARFLSKRTVTKA